MENFTITRNPRLDCWCVGEWTGEAIECFVDRDDAIDFGKWMAQQSISGRLTIQLPNGGWETLWGYGANHTG